MYWPISTICCNSLHPPVTSTQACIIYCSINQIAGWEINPLRSSACTGELVGGDVQEIQKRTNPVATCPKIFSKVSMSLIVKIGWSVTSDGMVCMLSVWWICKDL